MDNQTPTQFVDRTEQISDATPPFPERIVASKLREDIEANEYSPGERLKEWELVKRYESTRAAVRGALKALESESLVLSIPNRGYVVNQVTLADAEDIYQAREVLEGLEAKLFTARATPDQIEALEQALTDFATAAALPEDHTERTDRMFVAKNAFYEVLQDGCGNIIIRDFLRSLCQRIWYLRRRTLSRPGRSQQTLRELTDIVNAIKEGNDQKAQDTAMFHIRMAARVGYSLLRSRNTP